MRYHEVATAVTLRLVELERCAATASERVKAFAQQIERHEIVEAIAGP